MSTPGKKAFRIQNDVESPGIIRDECNLSQFLRKRNQELLGNPGGPCEPTTTRAIVDLQAGFWHFLLTEVFCQVIGKLPSGGVAVRQAPGNGENGRQGKGPCASFMTMKCRITRIALLLGSSFLTLPGLAIEAEALSYFVFEGVVERVDVGLEDRVKPGWTFSGSLESDSPTFAEPPVTFEYTLDERHIVEWFGMGLSEPPAERFFGEAEAADDESWIYVRVPVEHEVALSAEVFPGWVEFWLRADEKGRLPDRGNDAGLFRLHVWLDQWGAYQVVDGRLWTFSLGFLEEDPEAQIALLENLVAELRAEVTATTAERDVLRGRVEFLAGRLQGLEQTMDYVLVEKQALQAQLEIYEAAASAPELETDVDALSEQLTAVEGERAVLAEENDRLKAEAAGLADALAASEVNRLRTQTELDRVRRRMEASIPLARTFLEEPVSTPPGEAVQSPLAPSMSRSFDALSSSDGGYEPPRLNIRRGSRRR